jgi:tRNA-splicing ligase RtcB (3'-phosphate/5'-hydroxy nucleic acid ligase)
MADFKKQWDVMVFSPEGGDKERCLEQIRRSQAERSVLCADFHLGYSVPIGGVVAHKNAINVSGVGYDIACGNKAVLTDINADWLRANREWIADSIYKEIAFGIGRENKENVDADLFDSDLFDTVLTDITPSRGYETLRDMARGQLGTVGSGNHYVDVFIDDKDRVWVGVHFGSRGLGHKITTHFLRAAGASDGMDVAPCILGLDEDLGEQYFAAMNLAGEYAYAGRDYVCDYVTTRIMGGAVLQEVHNHHNFAWEEEHDGEQYIVVRKGATPARPGQEGFVGGSMGDISVILEGVESEDSREALYSTIHGAGRVMSRRAAAGKTKYKKGKRIRVSEGAISKKMMNDWITEKDVTLRGAGTDESPHCYKRIEEVLKAHEGTIRVKEILHPVIVAMAGDDEFDPYKD